MADRPTAPPADPRRALDWLPPRGEWRELWFTRRPALGPVPDEPVLADLEAAIAAGWAEDSGMTFGFDDDARADGARSMRAYCTTPAGLWAKAARGGTETGAGEATERRGPAPPVPPLRDGSHRPARGPIGAGEPALPYEPSPS